MDESKWLAMSAENIRFQGVVHGGPGHYYWFPGGNEKSKYYVRRVGSRLHIRAESIGAVAVVLEFDIDLKELFS